MQALHAFHNFSTSDLDSLDLPLLDTVKQPLHCGHSARRVFLTEQLAKALKTFLLGVFQPGSLQRDPRLRMPLGLAKLSKDRRVNPCIIVAIVRANLTLSQRSLFVAT